MNRPMPFIQINNQFSIENIIDDGLATQSPMRSGSFFLAIDNDIAMVGV